MTGDKVIDSSWIMLNEIATEDKHRRYKLASMVDHLNDAIQKVLVDRPDFRIDTDGTALAAFTELTTSTYTSQALPFDEEYRRAVAHLVASIAFQQDSSDVQNRQLSADHRSLYEEHMKQG